MSKTEVPMNRRWSDTEAAVLKHWAEEGLTLRQMAREAPEVLGWEPSEQQLFHFFHYRKIPYQKEKGGRPSRISEEMEEFMLKNYLKPLNRLWREFKEEFGEEFSRQEVYRLQYRTAEKVQQKQVKLTKLSMEWERLRATLSPTGRVATKHWLWRYLPLNENRQTSGVTFRTGG